MMTNNPKLWTCGDLFAEETAEKNTFIEWVDHDGQIHRESAYKLLNIAGEEGYRRGYRDGFIRVLDAVFDYWWYGKKRLYNLLFDFWQGDLRHWFCKTCNQEIWPPTFFVKCHYCEDQAQSLDHIIPRIQGGTDDIDNLVPCCRSCNSSKNGRTPEEWNNNIPITRHGHRVTP